VQNGVVLKEGDFVSLNGVTGEVIKGAQPVKKPAMTGDLGTFMKWVDAKRRLRVLTNAGEGCSAVAAVGVTYVVQNVLVRSCVGGRQAPPARAHQRR
jgi:hypothetical protein